MSYLGHIDICDRGIVEVKKNEAKSNAGMSRTSSLKDRVGQTYAIKKMTVSGQTGYGAPVYAVRVGNDGPAIKPAFTGEPVKISNAGIDVTVFESSITGQIFLQCRDTNVRVETSDNKTGFTSLNPFGGAGNTKTYKLNIKDGPHEGQVTIEYDVTIRENGKTSTINMDMIGDVYYD